MNLPPLDVAGQNQLLAFVGLAYKQGAYLAQVGEGTPVRLSLRYSGELGRVNPALYTATAAAGYLSGLGVPATPVNALLLAQQRGLQIVEHVHPEAERLRLPVGDGSDDVVGISPVGGNSVWSGRFAVCSVWTTCRWTSTLKGF